MFFGIGNDGGLKTPSFVHRTFPWKTEGNRNRKPDTGRLDMEYAAWKARSPGAYKQAPRLQSQLLDLSQGLAAEGWRC